MKREMEIVPISLSRNSHNNIFYEFFQIFFSEPENACSTPCSYSNGILLNGACF